MVHGPIRLTSRSGGCYEVAGGAGEDEEVPDEMGVAHSLPMIEEGAAGVGEAAGKEPDEAGNGRWAARDG